MLGDHRNSKNVRIEGSHRVDQHTTLAQILHSLQYLASPARHQHSAVSTCVHRRTLNMCLWGCGREITGASAPVE